jgi:acyl-coenzyme A synthetase/AMP-(fatty) acid ligase
VNPREVEAALLALPGVSDAAVLGIPDAARGESLLACLVARAGMTREEVMTFLRERVAAYKLPRRILFLPELPRSERGKLDRRMLLRQARLPED